MGQTRSLRTGRFDWQQTFAALKHPNYRLWFFGQMVSLFGTWMQSTAQGFLLYQLTHSTLYLGSVSFISGIPAWLLMLYGGVVADQVPRRTLLIITQICMMILAFILGALTLAHLVQPWHILVMALLLGIINAFDAPARQSFVLEMVSREDLTNAVALNATMFNTAVVVGPAAAGAAYAAVGPGWCFIINGVSFIAVIVALLLMKLKPFSIRTRHTSAISELREGLRYVIAHPSIRMLIALVGVASLFGVSFATLLPAWAVRILGGDSTTNGLLQSARGLGALLSALLIASLGRFKFKGRLLTIGSFAFPCALLIFSLVRWLPLSLLTLVGVGAAQILVLNLANALVQTLSADELRGRVMGIYSLIFFGFMPIGGLLAGTVAARTSEPVTVFMGATITLVFAALVWLFFPRLRALQ